MEANKKKRKSGLTNTNINKSRMIQALKKSLGIVATACKEVGISRITHYQWYKTDEDYRREVDDVGEDALDFAESHLLRQIQNGEVSSTIFYLKTKGKKRGYIERTELTGGDGNPLLPMKVTLNLGQ